MAKVNISVLVFQLVSVFVFLKADASTNNIYETPETIIANGYPAERHKVITEDGYILELHRIPSRDAQSAIVFLMHGLLAASNAFIALGTEYGVAYNYADAGFDVWMGNARGTRNSRNHTSLNPDDPMERRQFFDFSFEEIGIYDIAASVDYILDLTDQNELHYIGHSQGGTVFLVLNSMRPEYNNKFKSAHLLAGVGYQNHYPNDEIKQLAKFTDLIYSAAVALGVVELYPPTSNDENVVIEDISKMCTGNAYLSHLCDQLGMREIMKNVYSKNIEIGGAALKQVAHFGQNIRDKMFRRWNYGPIGNFLVYKRFIPPTYNLGLITVNVTIHYTVADDTLDERDVIAMSQDMAKASVRKVAKDTFLHSDFVNSEDAKALVTDYIIHAISTSD